MYLEPHSGKICEFTDLNAWKESHKLVLEIYEITKGFPKEEMYRLVGQMCRAGVSVTSNIAEGFSRNTAKDKMQFYAMALGSLTELQNQIILSKDLNYISENKFSGLQNQVIISNKLLHGLMKNIPSH